MGTQDCTIVAIDGDFNSKTLVTLGTDHWPYAISIRKSKMYVLVSGGPSTPCTINVYDLSGQLISQWDRKDKCHYVRPAIVSNQIVIPDTQHKQLTVYSLSGEVIKQIPYPQFTGSNWDGSTICTAGSNFVIVLTMNPSQVSKVNITTGEKVWTCNDVVKPQTAAIFGSNYVCVGSKGKISFLNINTG